jgi:hypothetical protein
MVGGVAGVGHQAALDRAVHHLEYLVVGQRCALHKVTF